MIYLALFYSSSGATSLVFAVACWGCLAVMCRRSILICGAVAIRALVAFASPVEGDVDFGSDAVERQTSTNESQVSEVNVGLLRLN